MMNKELQELFDKTEQWFTKLAILDESGQGNLTVTMLGIPRKWIVSIESKTQPLKGMGPTLVEAFQDMVQQFRGENG